MKKIVGILIFTFIFTLPVASASETNTVADGYFCKFFADDSRGGHSKELVHPFVIADLDYGSSSSDDRLQTIKLIKNGKDCEEINRDYQSDNSSSRSSEDAVAFIDKQRMSSDVDFELLNVTSYVDNYLVLLTISDFRILFGPDATKI